MLDKEHLVLVLVWQRLIESAANHQRPEGLGERLVRLAERHGKVDAQPEEPLVAVPAGPPITKIESYQD